MTLLYDLRQGRKNLLTLKFSEL